jgi:hypothetical protein
MPDSATTIPDSIRDDVLTLWDYNQMHHELRPTDVGIGLGRHDPNVATHTAKLFLDGYFPLIVFSGANADTTRERFPRGEAQHYWEMATALGVPPKAILLEPAATNTSENITLSRALLMSRGVAVQSVMLISRPYQQRRAFSTCRKVWPDVEVLCTSAPLALDAYTASIGSARLVIDMLVATLSGWSNTGAVASQSHKTPLRRCSRPIPGSSAKVSRPGCFECRSGGQ